MNNQDIDDKIIEKVLGEELLAKGELFGEGIFKFRQDNMNAIWVKCYKGLFTIQMGSGTNAEETSYSLSDPDLIEKVRSHIESFGDKGGLLDWMRKHFGEKNRKYDRSTK